MLFTSVHRRKKHVRIHQQGFPKALVIRTLAILTLETLVLISFAPIAEKQMLHTKGRLHSMGHITAFAIATFLMITGFSSRFAKIAAFAAALALAIFIEGGEHFVFYTPVEYIDISMDWLGVLVGTVISILVTLFSSRPSADADLHSDL